MTEWPFTHLGTRFFEGTVPKLVENIGKLATELKRYNDSQEPAVEAGEPGSCIIIGAPGENPDDCTTHEHEPVDLELQALHAIGARHGKTPEEVDAFLAPDDKL